MKRRPQKAPKTARQLLDEHETEKDFHDNVVALATLLHWRVWHDRATNAPSKCKNCGAVLQFARNPSGFPDLLLMRERLIWRELKREGEDPKPKQHAFGQQLVDAGEDYDVWRPSDWSSGRIEMELRRIDYR